MTITTECNQPYWKVIQEFCENKILKKYPEYGNSWKHLFDDNFWNNRLQNEVDEVKENSSFSQEARIEELIDVINVCAMQISNLLDSRTEEMVKMRLGV